MNLKGRLFYHFFLLSPLCFCFLLSPFPPSSCLFSLFFIMISSLHILHLFSFCPGIVNISPEISYLLLHSSSPLLSSLPSLPPSIPSPLHWHLSSTPLQNRWPAVSPSHRRLLDVAMETATAEALLVLKSHLWVLKAGWAHTNTWALRRPSVSLPLAAEQRGETN